MLIKWFQRLKDLFMLKIIGRYKCGCPVGTRDVWRDRKGRIRSAKDLRAVMVQCSGCGEIDRIHDPEEKNESA